jgi:hypothetical protein
MIKITAKNAKESREFEASGPDFIGAEAHLFMIVDQWASVEISNHEYTCLMGLVDDRGILGTLSDAGYDITITNE